MFIGFLLYFFQVFIYCNGLNFISPENVDKNLLASTNTGYVQGRQRFTYTGKRYWSFEGIPFAQPPLGNLRFRAPEPPLPWNGILDGTKEAHTCIETMNTLNMDIEVFGFEDCLYVNVYTPKNPKTSGRLLPVLVWIYGGAFMFGNSSSTFYGADSFLNQEIIVVTFNYRVGLFGFLSTEDLESPGNYGLKDQHFVLQWIQKNIKNFGGEKNRVTIYGQSAGSASVFYQLIYNKNKGLINSAIANSGSTLCNWALQTSPRKIAFDLGVGVGIHTTNSKELITKLRNTDTEMLKSASKLVFLLFAPQTDREGLPFVPTIEPPHKDAILTKTTYEIFEKGEFIKVPILMGNTNLETLMFSHILFLMKPLNLLYDLSPGSLPSKSMNIKTLTEKREAGRKILNHYFPSGAYINANDYQLLQYTSDDRFNRPIHKTVQLVSKHTKLYYYLFSYSSNYGKSLLRRISNENRSVAGFSCKIPRLLSAEIIKTNFMHLAMLPLKTVGVAHLEEQFYMWKRRNVKVLKPTGLDQLMSRRLIRIWSNFIHFRNPTPVKEKLLQEFMWPPVTSPNNITYIEIDKNFTLHQNFRNEHMEFWEELYQTYGHPPYLTY